ncbi:hypothetical protein Ahu01nite_082440 [Winogradskya humida]|uniref:Uncharacterized protein n=1 Tax=Winogradskya humida TaxID=113566 RepID=A0ABQ4A2R9_9ACTN|nr:hypothetical protein Ahu01nite_082440 [Actinoplanes humidus]
MTRVNGSGGGTFPAQLRPVREVTPAVEAAGAVDEARIFAEFAKRVGPDAAQIGETSPSGETNGQFTVDGAGAMVAFESVRRVEASFTYRCGAEATSGVARSWEQSRTGIMQCDAKKPRTEDVVLEVKALAC